MKIFHITLEVDFKSLFMPNSFMFIVEERGKGDDRCSVKSTGTVLDSPLVKLKCEVGAM